MWNLIEVFLYPNLIIKKYLKPRDNSKEKTKYLLEIKENNKAMEKFYGKISILFEKITEDKNTKLKEMLEGEIELHRKNIYILEKRNLEIEDIMSNHQQIIDDTKSFEKYIEECKG